MKVKALVTMDEKGTRKPFTIEFDSDTLDSAKDYLYQLLDQGKANTDVDIEHISIVQDERNFFL